MPSHPRDFLLRNQNLDWALQGPVLSLLSGKSTATSGREAGTPDPQRIPGLPTFLSRWSVSRGSRAWQSGAQGSLSLCLSNA